MYGRILIAYNGTQESVSALQECVRLAPGPSTEIHLLAVINTPTPPIVGDLGTPARFDAEEQISVGKKKMDDELARKSAVLKDAGLNALVHVEVGEPVTVIEECVKRLNIDLLIIGHSRHRSWAARWWRGSTDASLIERVPCTIMIAPGQH